MGNMLAIVDTPGIEVKETTYARSMVPIKL